VRSGSEKLQLRSVLADQHLPDGGRELGADPGVRHIADVIRYAGVAPDDLGPAAPAGGPASAEHGRKKREGVAVSAEPSKLDIRIPRDREGTFDPKLIAR
jgi:Transposase, Mutator family